MAVFTSLAVAGFLGIEAGTFTAITAAVLNAVVGIGLSLVTRALQGNQKQQSGGVNGKLQAGGDVARSIILGRTCTAGSLVYANAWGEADSGKTKNAYFTQVIALADHPVSELKGFWVYGAPVTIDTSGTETDKGWPVTEYRTKKGRDLLWIKFYDGTQTTADPLLTGSVSSADRPYTSDRVGRGVAYAVITSKFNTSYFSGFPTFKFELQGRQLYDPSKDTSVGGDGDQRRNDPTTWGGDGDDLPAVQVYNLLLGIYEDDTWVYGLQNVAAARLPASDWIAQINKCRVEKDGTGNGPQYTTGCEVTVDTPLSDTIDKILTGCNGRLIESGGIYKIRVGEPDDAVLSFTDEDIITTEEQSFTPFFGLSETVNGVTATYPEPEEAWNTKAAPPIYNAGYEAEDGDRRLLSQVEMGAVYRSIQVQRLMKSALAEARRARRHTFVLPPKYCVLEPGDVVSWTSERNGYSTKSFRVDGVAVKANLDVVVDITEVDPADYDWDPNTDYIPPVFSPVGPIFTPPQPMTGWDAEPYTNEKDGKQMPSIQVYFAGQLDDVQFVRIQVRYAGDTAIQFDGTVPYGDPDDNDDPSSVVLQGTFLPNTAYEVRGILLPYSGRETYWSNQDEDGTDGPWLAVTTPDVWISDIYPVDLDRLEQDVHDYLDWTGNAVRDVLDELRAVSAWAANQELSNFSDKQELRTELRSESGGITAAYTDAITVATGPGSALSQRIETLEAEIPDLASADAVDALTVRVTAAEGDIVSNADAITSLTTTVAGKADASTVAALSSTVSDQGDTITSQGSAITALQNEVDDPSTGLAANAAAVSSLGTTVTSQGDDITANAAAITALQASYGDVSAGATFRMGVDYTPSTGWDSRLGLETRVDTGDAFKAAGIYLESTEDDARILFDADQIAIVAGGDVAALFQAGTTFIDAARINKLVADDIEVTGRFDAALILQNGSLITDLIAFGAITEFQDASFSNEYLASGSGEIPLTTIPARDYATPIDISAVLTLVNTGSTVATSATLYRRDSSGDTEIAGVTVARVNAGTTSASSRIYDIDAPAESFSYVFKTSNGGTNPRTGKLSASVGLVWWKR